MRQPWFSSAVLAVLVLKCPLPIWMHSDIPVGLWSFETMQQSSENGLDLDEDCIVHSFCGCCYDCVLRTEGNCRYTVVAQHFNNTPPPPLPQPAALQGDERRPCSVIRCLSVLEGSSDRLQEAAFMPDDGDHRKQKCLFVPPGLGMSTISRGQYQILPSSSPNTHSCVRSGGILHQRSDKQAKAKPHTVVC